MSKPRDNEGALFKNDRRRGETDPMYSGTATVMGVEMWLSAWVNHDKSGKAYMKLKFRLKTKEAA